MIKTQQSLLRDAQARPFGRLLLGVAPAAIAAGLIAAPAQAQDAATTSLDEVVVTAQRRSENLQTVPIAVSVITADRAAELGVNDPATMQQIVPGFTITRTGNGAIPFIRGVGTTSGAIGNEPAVALFIDDVYIPAGAAAVLDFNNLDSVEVLKGPQGTLFGRNATGGVLNIRSRQPSFDPTAEVALTYESYNRATVQAYGSMGFGDKVAANLAAHWTRQGEGWGRNVVTGQEVFKPRSRGVQGKVLFTPDDDTSITLRGLYDRREGDDGAPGRNNPGTFGYGGFNPLTLNAGFYDRTNGSPAFYDTKLKQASARVSRDFSAARVVSITAFTHISTLYVTDSDATPAGIVIARAPQKESTFTQEFQILSPEDSPISWIMGAFYLQDKATFDASFTGVAFANQNATTFGRQKTTSISGFAQATAEILPATNLTIGIRYTSDHRKFDGSSSFATTRSPNFHDERTFSNLSGRFSLDHRFTDGVMGYVSYNRGFKSGLYNAAGQAPLQTTLTPPANPEDLNAYSIGMKTEFADRRVRLNWEGYYYDYKNIQVSTLVTGGTLISNGGAATIKGFEAELTVVPVDRLTVTANINLLDGKYDKFLNGPSFFPQPPNAPKPIPPGCGITAYPTPNGAQPSRQLACDLSGNKTANTPPFTSNVSVVYEIPTERANFSIGVSWAHGGDFYFDANNDPLSRQPTTDIFNGSISASTLDGRASLRLWVKNATKEKYYLYIAQSTSFGAAYAPAAPRTVGVTLTGKF